MLKRGGTALEKGVAFVSCQRHRLRIFKCRLKICIFAVAGNTGTVAGNRILDYEKDVDKNDKALSKIPVTFKRICKLQVLSHLFFICH